MNFKLAQVSVNVVVTGANFGTLHTHTRTHAFFYFVPVLRMAGKNK